MRDTTNCPVAFFLHFARSIAFFLHFARPIAFFFTLCRSHRFFFALCLSHCIFFALCPFHRFFLHFAGHIAFFLHFVCRIAFFLQFGGCFVFFLQSPVPIAFFLQREDWRSQRCIFFARRICIIRLLQFRLHFSLHFCIYFAFFSLFSLFFLHFELQVAKKMQREKQIGFHCFFFAPACSATSRVAFLGIRRVNPSLEAIRFPSFVLCQTQVGEFVTDDSRWKTRAKRERSSVLHINKYIYCLYLSINVQTTCHSISAPGVSHLHGHNYNYHSDYRFQTPPCKKHRRATTKPAAKDSAVHRSIS